MNASDSSFRVRASVRSLLTRLLIGAALASACVNERGLEPSAAPARPARTVEARLGATSLAQVREADLRKAFPEMGTESRLELACLWAESAPETAEAFFSPTPAGDHVVETLRVECNQASGGPVECRLFLAPAYFVADPDRFFTVQEGLAVDEAITVVRLFEQGALIASGERPEEADRGGTTEPSERRVFMVRKLSDGYDLQVSSADCGGCSGYLHVEPVFARGRMVSLRSDGIPATGCVVPPPSWLAQPR